jgi:hypothetical protein
MDEKTRRILKPEPDWLDKAKDPAHGTRGMWGLLASVALTIGGLLAFLLSWFGR